MTPLKKLIKRWENQKPKFFPANHIWASFISEAKEALKEEEEAPCPHPFALVSSRCNGEINICLKCGKDIEGGA